MMIRFVTSLGKPTSLFCGLCALFSTAANDLHQPRTATVRGVVFDSLTMKPAVGAAVWIKGSTIITTADKDGRFELRDVERGPHFLSFSSQAFDSLGMGSLGASVDIAAEGVTSMTLATPSFATLWRNLCRNQRVTGGDSGIMWGTIRDAATNARLQGAITLIEWTEPRVGARKQIEMEERSRTVMSDSTGHYYACGLPLATNLNVQSSGDNSLSGALQVIAGERKLAKLDMLVSPELTGKAATDTTQRDSSVSPPLRGSSIVRGFVRDDKLRALGEATVSLSALDTMVLTSADGSFLIDGLPAGTQQILVRKVGFEPMIALLHLRPGATTELTLSVNSVSELAGISVTAEAMASRDRIAFEQRRKAGFGYALESNKLQGRYDVQTALSSLPNLIASRNRGELTVTSFTQGRVCSPPTVWIDGFNTSLGEANMILPEELRAIEWFPRILNAPSRYVKPNSCAVILFWTKNSKWGK